MPTFGQDAYIAAHAGDSELRRFFLVQVSYGAGAVRWTTTDLAVFALGYKWEPAAVSVRGLSSQASESATGAMGLDLADANDDVSARIRAAASIVGTPVTVWRAWLAPGGATTIPGGVEKVYAGSIGRPRSAIAGSTIAGSYDLAPSLDMRAAVPLREAGFKCPFARHFKGRGCKSDGTATSCNGTLTACSDPDKVALATVGGNRERFGGFLDMPADGVLIEFDDTSYRVRAAPKQAA